eukprot:3966524-Pleurochrysis_carterae.AAC.1
MAQQLHRFGTDVVLSTKVCAYWNLPRCKRRNGTAMSAWIKRSGVGRFIALGRVWQAGRVGLGASLACAVQPAGKRLRCVGGDAIGSNRRCVAPAWIWR